MIQTRQPVSWRGSIPTPCLKKGFLKSQRNFATMASPPFARKGNAKAKRWTVCQMGAQKSSCPSGFPLNQSNQGTLNEAHTCLLAIVWGELKGAFIMVPLLKGAVGAVSRVTLQPLLVSSLLFAQVCMLTNRGVPVRWLGCFWLFMRYQLFKSARLYVPPRFLPLLLPPRQSPRLESRPRRKKRLANGLLHNLQPAKQGKLET